MNNLVTVPIPPDDVKKAVDLANQLITLLQPYLVSLTPEERQGIPKMADKTVAFVSKALSFAQSNPKYAPQDLDVPALSNDVQVVNDLHQIENPVQLLASLLHDTIMEAGSEAYVAALSYYGAVQSAARRNVPGAESIYDDLKIRFDQAKKKKETV